jgi:hypothetical protein
VRRTFLGPWVVMVALLPCHVRGQDSTAPASLGIPVSVAAGFGLGTPAIAGQASLTVWTRAGDFIVRYAGASEFEPLRMSEGTRDVALLYGRRRSGRAGWARIAGGLGHVRRVERGDVVECVLFFCRHEQLVSATVGLAAQADAVWALTDVFGFGISVLGNLNHRKSFAAATLTLHVGVLRERDESSQSR